ncbi:MAG: hypothetical protein ACQEXG_08435 [Pseudomonadota bacterium]
MLQLPEGVRLLLSGRHRPATSWHAGPAGVGVRMLSMAPRAISDATRLLEGLGFSGPQATVMARRLHGNPLAIQLAAATLPARAGFRLP